MPHTSTAILQAPTGSMAAAKLVQCPEFSQNDCRLALYKGRHCHDAPERVDS